VDFLIEWMVAEGQWEEARRERREYGPGALRDRNQQQRITALHSAVQLRYGGTALFDGDRLRAKWEGLRAWQTERGIAAFFPEDPSPEDDEDMRLWVAEHGEPVIPPVTEADVFGWYTHPIILALMLRVEVWDRGFAQTTEDRLFHFTDPEGSGYLTFARRGEVVHITSDEEYAGALAVPQAAFVAGVRDFITELAAQIRETAPELLDWPEVADLYVPE
jgi:hypothetical protein